MTKVFSIKSFFDGIGDLFSLLGALIIGIVQLAFYIALTATLIMLAIKVLGWIWA